MSDDKILIAIIGDLSEDGYNSCLNQGDVINVIKENEQVSNICKTLVISEKRDTHILKEIIKYSIQEKYKYLYLMNNTTVLNKSCIESHMKESPNDNSYSDYNYLLYKKRHEKSDEYVEHREYLFSIEPKLLNKAKQNIPNICLFIPKIVDIVNVLDKQINTNVAVTLSQLNRNINHIPYSLYKVKI